MKKLTIFLLSRNRPDYARLAVRSILAQTDNNFNLVVSDNSTDFGLRAVMAEEFPNVAYISRYPSVSLEKHYELIVNSVKTPYFVAFHDDDQMESTYVERILSEFEKNPSVAAIATNGRAIDPHGNPIGIESFFFSNENRIRLTCAESLINRYLSISFGGAAPFSSYAYRTKLLKGIPIYQSIARNYFDTIFLSILASRHGITWINESLVRVRYHDQRISSQSGVLDYKALITAIRSQYGLLISEKHIQEYRFANLLFALKTRRRFPTPALKYFLCTGIRLFLESSNFRSRVMRKASNLLNLKFRRESRV